MLCLPQPGIGPVLWAEKVRNEIQGCEDTEYYQDQAALPTGD